MRYSVLSLTFFVLRVLPVVDLCADTERTHWAKSRNWSPFGPAASKLRPLPFKRCSLMSEHRVSLIRVTWCSSSICQSSVDNNNDPTYGAYGAYGAYLH